MAPPRGRRASLGAALAALLLCALAPPVATHAPSVVIARSKVGWRARARALPLVPRGRVGRRT